MYVARKLATLKPSITLAISARAAQLRRDGHDVIALAAGEPDFGPLPEIREAASRAALEGPTRYGINPGHVELREATAAYLKRVKGIEYDPAEIIYSNGGKQALYNAMVGLVDEGDEVLILAPYWVTYPAQTELVGGRAVVVECRGENGFKVDFDELRSAITPRTRVLIFNNPANPSGAYYEPDEVRELTRICTEAGVAIISDEVYDTITYTEEPYLSPAAASPEGRESTALIGSLSKTFAIPGWRIGYLAGPQEWIKKVAGFQSQSSHHPSALSQAAALAALQATTDRTAEMNAEFRARRDYLLDEMGRMPGLEVKMPPEGAFYLMFDISGVLAAKPELEGSAGFCTWLLDEAKVALVPGASFGAEGYARLSYAASMEDLKQAVQRITQALDSLDL